MLHSLIPTFFVSMGGNCTRSFSFLVDGQVYYSKLKFPQQLKFFSIHGWLKLPVLARWYVKCSIRTKKGLLETHRRKITKYDVFNRQVADLILWREIEMNCKNDIVSIQMVSPKSI